MGLREHLFIIADDRYTTASNSWFSKGFFKDGLMVFENFILLTLMICITALWKWGRRRPKKTEVAGREHDKEKGDGFPSQNKTLALCLLNSLHLGSCFGVVIEGDGQRTVSVLMFVSPTCPFHLYLWTPIFRRESFGISPSCHPALGCDQSEAARKLDIMKTECGWLCLSGRLSERNACCLQDFCSHLNLSPLNLKTQPSGFNPKCTGVRTETKIPR